MKTETRGRPRTNVGKCSEPGCRLLAHTRGMCRPHYETALRREKDAEILAERSRASKRRQEHRKRKRGMSRLAAWIPKHLHRALAKEAKSIGATLNETLEVILELRYDQKAP